MNILFNLIVNSIFMFLTTCLLVEFFLFILRIKKHRIRYLIRLLPLFKLCFDIFNYNYSNWAFKDAIDPMFYEKNRRLFNIFWGFPNEKFMPYIGVGFQLENNKTFSIADILSRSIDSQYIATICISILIISLFFIFKRYIFEKRFQREIFDFAPFDFEIQNKKLKKQIEKRKIKICITKSISSPCTLKLKHHYILFSKKTLNLLNSEEIEAVISHELGHIIWKDQFLLRAIQYIKSFFWFIPGFNFWMKRISKEREFACDRYLKIFDLHPISIATAMKKIATINNLNPNNFMPFLRRDENLYNRVQVALKKDKKRSSWLAFSSYLFLTIILISLLFGKFWIF